MTNPIQKLGFAQFAKVLDASIQIGQPSILVDGDNDSGKSELLKTVSKRYDTSFFVDRVDMGGIRHLLQNDILTHYRTLFVSDMLNILSRNSPIIKSALAEINNLIDGKVSASMDYQSVQKFRNFEEYKKSMNISF